MIQTSLPVPSCTGRKLPYAVGALGLTFCIAFFPGAGLAQPQPFAVALEKCAVSDAPSVGMAAPMPSNAFDVVEAGDRVKLAFFEIIQVQEDKWGADRSRAPPASRGFQLRSELSGEYLIQEDGSIVLPLFGAFRVVGIRMPDLQRSLECAFGVVMGRPGTVNVLSVTKRPVYVVGPVRKSGSFEFMPGMTVIQALALAGGIERTVVEPFQAAEVTREAEKLQQALDRAVRNLARASVLSGERSGSLAVEDLGELTGTNGRAILSEEANTRRLELMAQRNQESALEAAIASAQADVQARSGQVEGLRATANLRRERFANLNKLATTGSIGQPVILQAQAELSEAENRLSEAMMAIAVAEDRLGRAKQDLARLKLQSETAYQKELLGARMEARKALVESEGLVNVAKAMIKSQNLAPGLQELEFRISRRNGVEVTTIKATETTLLKPGDVLHVVSAVSGVSKVSDALKSAQ